ncbi:MAG: hypothetical protein JRJ59_09300, partial [Deltaproteobacteria bacterium]|nr:hypothetical protein [Deltaproteobacteria bacterium]
MTIGAEDSGRVMQFAEAGPMLRRCLVPGAQVEVTARPRGMVESLIIYQVEVGRRLFLSEPKKNWPSRQVDVSFVIQRLDPAGQEVRRYGFTAAVLERLKALEISSGQKGPAVVVEYPFSLKVTTLRHFYRLEVPRELGLRAELAGFEEEVELVEISLAGCRLVGSGPRRPDQTEFLINFSLKGVQPSPLAIRAKAVHGGLLDKPGLDWRLGLLFDCPPVLS